MTVIVPSPSRTLTRSLAAWLCARDMVDNSASPENSHPDFMKTSVPITPPCLFVLFQPSVSLRHFPGTRTQLRPGRRGRLNVNVLGVLLTNAVPATFAVVQRFGLVRRCLSCTYNNNCLRRPRRLRLFAELWPVGL